MTDVSNLDDLALRSRARQSHIKNYAKAQAAATQSQELDIQLAKTLPPPGTGLGGGSRARLGRTSRPRREGRRCGRRRASIAGGGLAARSRWSRSISTASHKVNPGTTAWGSTSRARMARL